ncbi:MAG: TRAP transporter small permease subunit, partial [Bacteroidota bacterium]
MQRIRHLLDQLNERTGRSIAWLSLGLVGLVFFNVFLRYVLNSPSAWLKELEWHFFALLFLLSAGYAYLHDRHVRVDLFYDRMSAADQQTVNRWGTTLFLLPWCLVLMYFGWQSALAAYAVGERSAESDGLSNLWLIQFAIPLGMGLLFLQGVSVLLRPTATRERQERNSGAWLILVAILATSFVGIYLFPDAFTVQRLSLLLFAGIFLLILYGFPVAFTLGGLSLVYALCFLPLDSFGLLPLRIYGIMAKEELMAVPLFIFMG